ncbi:transposase family protein [Candidatus Pacearchaeota archaeon]|nr:transposase family protein [Candidatus Pacearchaeota archaeon]
MRKLNQKKVKYIVKGGGKRDIGFWTIAHTQHISPQHARKVYRKYKGVKEPRLLPCGRKPKQITEMERKLVIETKKEFRVGATMIEQILDERGVHINHNRIHKILLEAGLAKEEPKKKKVRRYKGHQRKHSLSLAHGDWFEFKRWKIMLIEDDASRFITGYGKFKQATSENTIKVFERSLKWGKPKQFHSDHGPQFTCNEKEGKKAGEGEFSKVLKNYGIKQIFARIKRPQANGKVERLISTIKRLWAEIGSLEKAVKHYNFKRPHRSLTNGKLRTPYQAFHEKQRK